MEVQPAAAIPLTSLRSFESASAAVIEYLQTHLNVGPWLTTRVNGPDQFVLAGESEFYGLKPGAHLPWKDTFCNRMVAGKGPQIALDASEIASFMESPLLEFAPVGSYVGVPISTGKGELFGTLYALHPENHKEKTEVELPLITLLAQLLGSIASLELEALRHGEHVEQLKTTAFSDLLTGVANRNGWEQHLKQVQSTVSGLGSPVGIFIIDLNEMKQVNDSSGHVEGDNLLKQTAALLSDCVSSSDLVARIGGDEFAIAALECSEQRAQQLERSINASFVKHGISASVGYSWHRPWQTVAETVIEADKDMYRVKKAYQKKP